MNLPTPEDLSILAKIILPYHRYKNTWLDKGDDQENREDKDFVSLGISFVTSANPVPQTSASFVLDFTGCAQPEGYETHSFFYMSNPDGSIRWLFPKNLKAPTFLAFYSASSWKSKMLTALIRLGFRYGLQRWICSGSFVLYAKEQPCFLKLSKSAYLDNYSLFLGTVGPNRKAVMEINTEGKTTHFVKIALTKRSEKLLRNEFQKLDKVNDGAYAHLQSPYSFLFSEGRCLIQPSVYTKDCKRQLSWTSLHTQVKLEMERKRLKKKVLLSDFKHHQLQEVSAYTFKQDQHHLLERLASHVRQICSTPSPEYQVLPVSLCHHDFTPWNMYVSGEQLKVYDWELAGYGPVLSDLFHFHFQKGVMMKGKNYRQISQELFSLLAQPEWKRFVGEHKLDVHLQLAMYLVYTVNYYLGIYSEQKNLHWQALALLEVWEEALEEVLARQRGRSFRKQFIESFFVHLQSTSYAYLKFIYGSLDNLPEETDIDLLIAPNDLAYALKLIEGSVLVERVRIVRKSFMVTAHLFFKDGSFLSIDLLISFKRTNLVMMKAKEVLAERKMENGLSVASPKHNLEYMLLFYQLNGSAIPERHRTYFHHLAPALQKQCEDYISGKYILPNSTLDEIFAFHPKIASQLSRQISFSHINVGLYSIINSSLYFWDTLMSLKTDRGFTLSISGVDGAGKSTVIGQLKELLELKYRKKVIVLRHRPSVLPILSAWVHGKKEAEERTTRQFPRTGHNQSKVKSLFRFGYYLSDYLFGQLYIYFKYILRGKVVIYDRYYFDFINDAKRSNIVINPWIPKVFYPLIHKPELNVFLYASASEILKRKQELQASEIEGLTSSYHRLFAELTKKDKKNEYLAIHNLNLKDTLQEIESKITKVA